MRTIRSFQALGVLWGAGALFMLSGCSVHQSIPPSKNNPSNTINPNVIEAQPDWFSCKAASDCQAEPGVCNPGQGVNKSFVAPFRQYREAMSNQVGCAVDKQPASTTNAEPQCVSNRCTIPATKK
jgi:hypothetical protein